MLDIENVASKNVSYLHARDPSILAWNKHGLNEVRVNLAKELLNDNTGRSTETQEKEEHNIQVFLRIKDGVFSGNLYDIKENHLICKVPEGSHSLRNIKEGESMTKTYSFSKIFGPKSTQIEIFNDIVKSKVLGFINGKNSTLLTYGASGSGKTFTIVGTPDEPGIIPRALEYVYRTIHRLEKEPKVVPLPNGEIKYIDEHMYLTEKLQKSAILNATLVDRSHHIKTYRQMQQRLSSESFAEIDELPNVSVSVWVSFAEIYNESIFDLLKGPPSRGKQRHALRLGYTKGSCFIKDLTHIHVSSGIEAYQILQYGLHNLNYAATSVNSHSSRSHSIFTMKLIQTSELEDTVYISTFNFCDLAGSERLKKTMNVGDRLKESNNINTSLLVLGRCMNSIRSAQQLKDNRPIPFRESKLTQLFQKALAGWEDIMMIVNINPSLDMFDESQHVLNFSAIAKEILVEEQPRIVKPKKTNRFSQYMERKTACIPPVQEVEEDERDMEINDLKVIISKLYIELENKKREYDIELKLEREHIISCYKEICNETKRQYEEYKTAAVNKIKKEYEDKVRELKNHYTKLLNEQVIDLDSSSEDEDSSSRGKYLENEIKNLENVVSGQVNKICLLQQELCDVQAEREKLEKDIQVLPKLNEQIKELTEESINLKIMLKDAEKAYCELQTELQQEKVNCKKLISENLQMKESLDFLGQL